MRRVESGSGCPSEAGAISLRDAYFTAARILAEGGVDPVVAGSLAGFAQEVDTRAVDEIRNLLFATNTQGFDLLAFNVQRGRDHGLPDYNSVRAALGLPRARSFEDIVGVGGGALASSDAAAAERARALARALSDACGGNVSDVDLLVGGLAEPHVPGGSVGELFAALIADVFVRIRDADRFWFERADAPQAALLAQVATLDELRATRVADLLARSSEALDGRFGLEVVASEGAAARGALGARARLAARDRLPPEDSLFFARPEVLQRLDAECGGAWAAEVEAADEGLRALREEGGAAAGAPATRRGGAQDGGAEEGGDAGGYGDE